jgi:eukaryotic-like serine/threonine-protein kinase
LPVAPAAARYSEACSLGEGGHGTVHRCIDLVLRRPVAVKRTRAQLLGDEDTEQLLEREARILARLEHPNIIPIYDAGRDPEHGPYYVMREVEQLTLEHVLDRLRLGDPQATRDFTQKRLLRMFMQICRAIDYVNSRGVVHCDLKPANILLGDFGQVLIADWGMAALDSESYRPHGGTHGFMAPEQYRIGERLDARTDVFALGAILYEALTLQPAMSRDAPRPHPGSGAPWLVPPIVPPSERAPDRKIAVELDHVCQRALCTVREQRFQRAGELADAIEQVLEGTLELERRAAEAERQVELGCELAGHYRELDEARPESVASIARLKQRIPPWAPLEAKRARWELEDMLEITDALRVRTFQAAAAAFEQALDAVPGHTAARRRLAELYHVELEHARRRRDESNRIYFQRLVEQNDVALLGGGGTHGVLDIKCRDAVAELTLETYREQDRRLIVTESQPLAAGSVSLLPGTYRVVVRCAGRAASMPISLGAGDVKRLRVDADLLRTLADDEVLVCGGTVLLGGSHETDATEPREINVPAFVMQRFPTTFSEYLSFLDALAEEGQSAKPHLPCSDLGVPLVEFTGAGFQLGQQLRAAAGDGAQRLPVFGVTVNSAAAYARWLSRRTGMRLRLPTDDEWEKAARGADGRLYPWGNHFEATFCKMRTSRPGPSSPSPVGAFAADESPFGVRDLAGGVADWTVPSPEMAESPDGMLLAHSRGGAWCDQAADCRLPACQEYAFGARSQRVGFRLVRPLP